MKINHFQTNKNIKSTNYLKISIVSLVNNQSCTSGLTI